MGIHTAVDTGYLQWLSTDCVDEITDIVHGKRAQLYCIDRVHTDHTVTYQQLPLIIILQTILYISVDWTRFRSIIVL